MFRLYNEIMEFELQDIKKLRTRLGLRQSQLASLAGVSQSLIAKIERGKIDPAYSKVKAILQALDSAKNTEEEYAKDAMNKEVIFLQQNAPVEKAVRLMKEKGFSQIPVLGAGGIAGTITEGNIMDAMVKFGHEKVSRLSVGKIMSEPLLCVRENTPCRVIAEILKAEKAVLVTKEGRILGIITKMDLI